MKSFWLAAVALLLGCAAPEETPGQPASEPATGAVLLSVWEPSPDEAVERMLRLTSLQPGEVHFDLGSGDGRFVLAAATLGAQSTGYEIDPELIENSRSRIAQAGLEGQARILNEDLLKADFASADVVTMYLTPESYPPLVPLLESKLREGARIAAYKFPVPGWNPDKIERWQDRDPDIPLHEVFFYQR